MSVVNCKV